MCLSQGLTVTQLPCELLHDPHDHDDSFKICFNVLMTIYVHPKFAFLKTQVLQQVMAANVSYEGRSDQI